MAWTSYGSGLLSLVLIYSQTTKLVLHVPRSWFATLRGHKNIVRCLSAILDPITYRYKLIDLFIIFDHHHHSLLLDIGISKSLIDSKLLAASFSAILRNRRSTWTQKTKRYSRLNPMSLQTLCLLYVKGSLYRNANHSPCFPIILGQRISHTRSSEMRFCDQATWANPQNSEVTPQELRSSNELFTLLDGVN